MKCPGCGAPEELDAGAKAAYKCGAYYVGPVGSPILISPGRCYERQITTLQKRLETWRRMYKRTANILEEIFETFCPDDLQELKEMGEIK